MELTLAQWVDTIASNGFVQQTPGWLLDKENTYGGSSLPTIIGENPYSSIGTLIRQRVGLEKFGGDIKTRWGNLFEDVIKDYTERRHKTRVYGENLYYKETPDSLLAYSPDGLCVMKDGAAEQICLLEFKCPYSRIPTSTPPGYYIPQVKMGLAMISVASTGLLVEAVFKRCTRADFNKGSVTVERLRSHPAKALAKGVIALWCESGTFQSMPTRDLSEEPDDILSDILEQVCDKVIKTAHIITGDCDPAAEAAKMYPAGALAVGYLPWKLLKVVEHVVEKEPDFLHQHMDKITEIDEVIKKCRAVPLEMREEIVTEYLSNCAEARFC